MTANLLIIFVVVVLVIVALYVWLSRAGSGDVDQSSATPGAFVIPAPGGPAARTPARRGGVVVGTRPARPEDIARIATLVERHNRVVSVRSATEGEIAAARRDLTFADSARRRATGPLRLCPLFQEPVESCPCEACSSARP